MRHRNHERVESVTTRLRVRLGSQWSRKSSASSSWPVMDGGPCGRWFLSFIGVLLLHPSSNSHISEKQTTQHASTLSVLTPRPVRLSFTFIPVWVRRGSFRRCRLVWASDCEPCTLRSANLSHTGSPAPLTPPCPGAPGSGPPGHEAPPPESLAPPSYAAGTCRRGQMDRQGHKETEKNDPLVSSHHDSNFGVVHFIYEPRKKTADRAGMV